MTKATWLPCGRCFECKMHKANDWATRLMAESITTPPTHFLTLTYDEQHIPKNTHGKNTFDSQHLKRINRELSRVHKGYRYYGIAEHGTTGERPHYHLLTFGPSSATIDQVLNKYWPYGFYTIGELLGARIMYVALFHVLKSHKYKDEFVVMSRRPGIGAYLLEDEQFLKAVFRTGTGEISLMGERRLLPRYLLDRHGDDDLKERIKEHRRKFVFDRYQNITGYTIVDGLDLQRAIQAMPDEALDDLLDTMDEINRRKVDAFRKNHRKSRHVDDCDFVAPSKHNYNPPKRRKKDDDDVSKFRNYTYL